MINQTKLLTHQIRNAWHTFFLFTLMSFILMLLSYVVIGFEGVLWALFLSITLLLISPQIPPQLVLKMYSARLLYQSQAGEIHQIINELSRRAGLTTTPQIYYIPSSTINAFTVGSKKNPSIALTEGLLNILSTRELVAVLAHEVSHIYHNDMMVMSFADIINRVATMLSLLGITILCFSLPFYALGLIKLYWPAILILILSPLVLSIIQLTLSRTREFSADMKAISLTGDAEGLVMALNKINVSATSTLTQIFFPMKKRTELSVLRTHPKTEERIKRLLSLHSYQIPKLDYQHYQQFISPNHYQILVRNPRWHISGLWY